MESTAIAARTIIAILYIGMMAISIPFNLLFIMIVMIKKSYRTPVNVLVSNLSLAGLIIAAFLMPFKIYELFNPKSGFAFPKSVDMCRFRSITPVASIFCIALTLVTICADRCLVIVYPMKPYLKMTCKKAYLFIPISWLISFVVYIQYARYTILYNANGVISCLPFYPENNTTDITIRNATGYPIRQIELTRITFWTMHISISFIIPIILLVSLYSLVIYRLWISPENSQRPSFMTKNARERLLRKRKVIKILIACCIVFLVNNVPYFVVFIIVEFRLLAIPNVSLVIQIVTIIYTSAIAYNPILYGYYHVRSKNALSTNCCCVHAP
ncbi:Substance-K receptor [Trichoplax sp. H2]|nr:Substance-K receptor [Trichoplax sp. H2]|eukprot:RDD42845.1 Substance-K receptor [Trichoplax sp. H2]